MMELVALPVSSVVLVWVFGGLLAATVPIAVGALCIVASMAVLRLLALVTDVSVLALNLCTALGFALAIDYTLLIVSRYRDELADGQTHNARWCAPWPPRDTPSSSPRSRWCCRWRRWRCSPCRC